MTSDFHFDPSSDPATNRGAADQPVIGIAAYLALRRTVLPSSRIAGPLASADYLNVAACAGNQVGRPRVTGRVTRNPI